MFKSARLKLTAWYLLIIMIISISFSSFIYFGLSREFDRVLRIQEYRIEHPATRIKTIIPHPIWENDDIPFSRPPDTQVITEARTRLLEGLIGVNFIIFIFSALAGYFLAGTTLKPIKEMVDEQNRFITDASHELNTPLTSLKTSAEVNLRNKKLTLKEAKEALISNLEEVNNLQLLSDELIKITQYQKPNGNFKFVSLSLKEVIGAATARVYPMAKEKNINIKTQIKDFTITGEKRSMIELFTILLDNAVKYSPEKKEISISTQKPDHKIKILVKDNGLGIDKKDLPHIFDRFFRADQSRTKQNVSGYGLGLSIAQKIAQIHNGNISVDSVVNKGSVFTVTLPLNV